MIEHDCKRSPVNLNLVKGIYGFRSAPSLGSSESLAIYRCRCGRLWKIRHQCDQGTGRDDIWLAPGDEIRGLEFSLEEAAEFEAGDVRNCS